MRLILLLQPFIAHAFMRGMGIDQNDAIGSFGQNVNIMDMGQRKPQRRYRILPGNRGCGFLG